MRINRFVAHTTGMSRRAADVVIAEGRVLVNGKRPELNHQIEATDRVTYNGHTLSVPDQTITVVLNKPPGYVSSREGQGSSTIYQLLPKEYSVLKPVGRLDKDSSGLIVLTNDGDLANRLSHPSFEKQKVYLIRLDRDLTPADKDMIEHQGVTLDEGNSKFTIERIQDGSDKLWRIRLHEGRNRQIRRTFGVLGYSVIKLHRVKFGPYTLGQLPQGKYMLVS